MKLVCPDCGEDGTLRTIEEIEGHAHATFVEHPDGRRDIEFEGETEVLWDSSTTVGVHCTNCGWESQDRDWLGKLATSNLGKSTPAYVIRKAAEAWAQMLEADGAKVDKQYIVDLTENPRFIEAVTSAWRAGHRGWRS